MLQTKACNFTIINIPPWPSMGVFCVFQVAQRVPNRANRLKYVSSLTRFYKWTTSQNIPSKFFKTFNAVNLSKALFIEP